MAKLTKLFRKSKSKNFTDKNSSWSVQFVAKKMFSTGNKNKNKKSKKSKKVAKAFNTAATFDLSDTSQTYSTQNGDDPLLRSYDKLFEMRDSDISSEEENVIITKRSKNNLVEVKDSGVFIFDSEDGAATESNPSLESYFYNVNISPIKEIEETKMDNGKRDVSVTAIEENSGSVIT